jgi:hypothetical protein
MTQSTAPIVLNWHGTHPVAGGQTDVIRQYLNGAAPLTITGTRATGETVWLAPRTQNTWVDDAVTVTRTDIAYTRQHPVYGEITYAYIDETRLDQAPTAAAQRRRDMRRMLDTDARTRPAQTPITDVQTPEQAKDAGRRSGIDGEIWD